MKKRLLSLALMLVIILTLVPNGDSTLAALYESDVEFDPVIVGYSDVESAVFSVSNIETFEINGVVATISTGGSYFEIVSQPASSIPVGGYVDLVVRPRLGLQVGVYTGVLTVTMTNSATQTIQLSFTVNNVPIIENPHSDWATLELIRAAEIGIIPDSLVDPSIDYRRPITRIEFAGIAVKTYESLAGVVVQPSLYSPFYDTSAEDALKALGTGLMVGFSDTEFSPYTLLTREQALVLAMKIIDTLG